jgi:adenylate kinase
MFRAAQTEANPGPALHKALEAMRRGELVPDDVVVEMVRERAARLRCPRGFLLDGFPRTRAQAEALDELLRAEGLTLDAVVNYEVALNEVVSRLGGRRTCPVCKAVYHVVARPPRAEGICDHCGGSLSQLDDDRPEAIRTRLRAYDESNRPLADYYARAGKLLSIRASGTPEEILAGTLAALDERLAPAAAGTAD